jgi:hypothetical protein
VSGIPLQKGKNHFCKEDKRRCLAGEERRLHLEGKKIPAHMTRANVSQIIPILMTSGEINTEYVECFDKTRQHSYSIDGITNLTEFTS